MWSFDTDGIVRLEGALPRADADAMADAIWRFVERKTEHRRGDPSTWSQGQPLLSFKALKRHSAFTRVIESAAVTDALDGVFGAGRWVPPKPGGQVLMTFPNATEWTLPTSLWHMDVGFGRDTWPTYGVKLFVLLADHDPGGGATLALRGSHLLVDDYTKTLRPTQYGGGKERWHRFVRDVGFMDAIERGDRTDVVEMCGNAGDVYVTHIHTFHCVAPNAAATPRLMLGKYVAAA